MLSRDDARNEKRPIYKPTTLRWEALTNRDADADGTFIYGVITTGIYCRPSCPSRNAQPRERSVTTKRWTKPSKTVCVRANGANRTSLSVMHTETVVAKACRMIDGAETEIKLDDLAKACGLSPYHFHRVFKRITGLTPKAYSKGSKAKRMQESLSGSDSVTNAIYDSLVLIRTVGSMRNPTRSWACNQRAIRTKASDQRSGSRSANVRWVRYWSVQPTSGSAPSISTTMQTRLVKRLQDQFPKATLKGGDKDFEQWVAKVVGIVEDPEKRLDLPVDVQGSVFQKQVWQALCQVPAGKTATYAEIAEAIGRPRSVRAVANAIGSNNHAVAIPCHRVIRSDGALSGYRWGVERKQALLELESAVTSYE